MLQKAIGLLLIFSALMKALEIFSNPVTALANAPFGYNWGRVILPILISCEFGIGTAALTGVYWKKLRWVAMPLFLAFSCHSLNLAIQGADSCGCFGAIAINPWWTFLIDVVVLTKLVMEITAAAVPQAGILIEETRLRYAKYVGTAIVLVTCFLAVFLISNMKPSGINRGLSIQTVGNVSILEPEKWVGKKMPITKFIDIDVASGQWVVVLHQQECSKCQAAIAKYEQLATYSPEIKVALIEVPPYGPQFERPSNCRVGRLSDSQLWFVRKPLEIRLNEGVVLAASLDLPAINSSEEL